MKEKKYKIHHDKTRKLQKREVGEIKISDGKVEYEKMIKRLQKIGHFDENENLTEKGKQYVLKILKER
nr:MAG: hypothetical protein [Lokiarchaeota virus Ratatoskr Meg22_1012]